MRRVSLLGRAGERGGFDELMMRHMRAFFFGHGTLFPTDLPGGRLPFTAAFLVFPFKLKILP